MTKLFLLLTLLVPAQTVQSTPKPPKNLKVKNATLEQLYKYCPIMVENYAMPKSVYDPAQGIHLIRINGCLETKSVLVVSWIGKNRKLERIFSELVATHYATFKSEKDKKQYSVKYITTKSQKPIDPRLQPDFKGMAWFAFYDLAD